MRGQNNNHWPGHIWPNSHRGGCAFSLINIPAAAVRSERDRNTHYARAPTEKASCEPSVCVCTWAGNAMLMRSSCTAQHSFYLHPYIHARTRTPNYLAVFAHCWPPTPRARPLFLKELYKCNDDGGGGNFYNVDIVTRALTYTLTVTPRTFYYYYYYCPSSD